MDTKKLVEELAKQAGVNAKGARPCCSCDTYQNAVAEAEALMEDLARNNCPDFTYAVLAIAHARYKAVMMRSAGVLPTVSFIREIATESNDLGMPIEELMNACSEWHDEVNPTKGKPV